MLMLGFRLVLLACALLLAAPSLPARAALVAPSTTLAITASLPMFNSEAAAQKHCLKDVVVWLNTRSGIYHEKGMRWYGRTKQGAFVCRKEANAAGFRDTRNGQ